MNMLAIFYWFMCMIRAKDDPLWTLDIAVLNDNDNAPTGRSCVSGAATQTWTIFFSEIVSREAFGVPIRVFYRPERRTLVVIPVPTEQEDWVSFHPRTIDEHSFGFAMCCRFEMWIIFLCWWEDISTLRWPLWRGTWALLSDCVEQEIHDVGCDAGILLGLVRMFLGIRPSWLPPVMPTGGLLCGMLGWESQWLLCQMQERRLGKTLALLASHGWRVLTYWQFYYSTGKLYFGTRRVRWCA